MMKVPGNKSSTSFSLQGTNVPCSESATYGTFAPGSESPQERKLGSIRALVKSRSADLRMLHHVTAGVRVRDRIRFRDRVTISNKG